MVRWTRTKSTELSRFSDFSSSWHFYSWFHLAPVVQVRNRYDCGFLPSVFLDFDTKLWLFLDVLVIRGVSDSWNLLSSIRKELNICRSGPSFKMVGSSVLSVCDCRISQLFPMMDFPAAALVVQRIHCFPSHLSYLHWNGAGDRENKIQYSLYMNIISNCWKRLEISACLLCLMKLPSAATLPVP